MFRVYPSCQIRVWSRLPGEIHKSEADYLVFQKAGSDYLDLQSGGGRIPGFSNWTGRIPGFSNWRARIPGKIRSEGQITSTKFLQQWTRLPGRDQITWSRPKVGQIAWARSIGDQILPTRFFFAFPLPPPLSWHHHRARRAAHFLTRTGRRAEAPLTLLPRRRRP